MGPIDGRVPRRTATGGGLRGGWGPARGRKLDHGRTLLLRRACVFTRRPLRRLRDIFAGGERRPRVADLCRAVCERGPAFYLRGTRAQGCARRPRPIRLDPRGKASSDPQRANRKSRAASSPRKRRPRRWRTGPRPQWCFHLGSHHQERSVHLPEGRRALDPIRVHPGLRRRAQGWRKIEGMGRTNIPRGRGGPRTAGRSCTWPWIRRPTGWEIRRFASAT